MAGTAGRSGRRPKPTARKELAGNPGKRALNKPGGRSGTGSGQPLGD